LINFRLFRIPITVRPTFMLIALLLGFSAGFDSIQVLLGWVVVVVVSILIHELGHALTARSFGAGVQIELNGLGGLTRWGLAEGDLPPGKRALVAAAGSAVGLVFGGLVWAWTSLTDPITGTAGALVRYLIYVNVYWGLFNWLPIRPLDGGHLLTALLAKLAPSRAERIARVIFTATAALALLAAVRYRLIFAGILAAWLLMAELGGGARPVPRAGLPTLGYDDQWAERETEEAPPEEQIADPERDERHN
jgi:Zn-dependent protease